MKTLYGVLLVVAVVGLGCASVASMFDKDEQVALSKVPPAALDAAKAAVPGIVPTEAEMEKEDGQTVYDVVGTADGKTYEIEVTAEGKVREVETKGDKDHD